MTCTEVGDVLKAIRTIDMGIQCGTAVEVLPPETQHFFHHVLGNKQGHLHGWNWTRVAQTHDTRSTPLTSICFNGRPSWDIEFVWVYSHQRDVYELYLVLGIVMHEGMPRMLGTRYAPGPIATAHTLAGLLNYISTRDFRSVYEEYVEWDNAQEAVAPKEPAEPTQHPPPRPQAGPHV